MVVCKKGNKQRDTTCTGEALEEKGVSSTVVIAIAVVALSVAFVSYYILTSEDREVKYETYLNEVFFFKFDYPAGWIFWEEGWVLWPQEQSFIATENIPENEEGGHIKLTIHDKANFEEDVEFILEGLGLEPSENLFGNLTILIENTENNLISGPTITTIDNAPAIRYSAIKTVARKREDNTGRFVEYEITVRSEWLYFLKDNYLYSFNTFCKKEKYSGYESIFEHVINSFSFLRN